MGREASEWAFRDPWLRSHLVGRLQGPSRTESMTLSGTAPGWEPPEDPDTGSECSHPEVTPSPRFVAAKTQSNQSGKKAPASVVRCTSLLHRTPPATQTQTFRAPNSGSPASKAAAGTVGLSHRCLPGFPPTTCRSCSPARTRLEFPSCFGADWDPWPLATSVTLADQVINLSWRFIQRNLQTFSK